jgi:hypothetical protein
VRGAWPIIAALRAAALALALAAPVLAQPAPAPAQPATSETDARLSAARKLMETTGAIGMARQMIDGLEQQLVQIIASANPGKEAQVQSLVTELLMPEFRARIGELEEPTLRVWADAFTVAEMDELLAFYATPIGRKTLSVMPQLSQQSSALGMAWGQRVAQDAIAKHERAIRDRGIRL